MNDIAVVTEDQLPVNTDLSSNSQISPVVQLMMQSNQPAETLEKMLDLQERYDANEAKKAYHAAMAEARAKMGTALKSQTNSHLGNRYATLDDLIIGASPALSDCGFNFSWDIQQSDTSVTAICIITHAGGHEESTSVVMPVSAPLSKAINAAQNVGVAITYAKRYSFSALVGIATDDTDAVPPAAPVETVSETDMADFQAVCEEVGKDYTKWKEWISKKHPPIDGDIPTIPLESKKDYIDQIRRAAGGAS